MDHELFESKLDHHLFFYHQLMNQLSDMQAFAHHHGIGSYEAMMGDEAVRDALLLKFVLLQRTVRKVGVSILEHRYKLNLKPFPFLDAEYFDQNCTVHYDCAWALLEHAKPLKRQLERIKKYDDGEVCSGHGDEVRCSFCGKISDQVAAMIAGPYEAICCECVELCNEALRDVLGENAETESDS